MRRAWVTLVLVALIAACTLDTAVALRDGHADLGPALVDGRWAIRVTDDSGAHDPADVILAVGDAARGVVPESEDYSFLGPTGSPVWLIPQTRVPGVLWLGWRTEPAVTLSLHDIEGPGPVHVYFDYGGFRAPEIIWDGAGPARSRDVPAGTHAHANWAFGAAGDYRATFTATVASADGKEETASATLRFAVGS